MLSRNVAIVGGGPAGFFASGNFLKKWPNCRVDMFEKLPVPFGLLRYGVAPDNPNARNVTTKFERIMDNPRFSFNGNVIIGKDVNLFDLHFAYHIVVVATGAQIGNRLPEDDFPHQLDAHEIMRWINGHPSTPMTVGHSLQKSGDFVIVGIGNAALDVGRILLMGGTSYLSQFECYMPSHVNEILNSLRIGRIRLIARRTALSSAFSTREFRHCSRLFSVRVENGPDCVPPGLSRADKRKMELIMSCHGTPSPDKEMILSYLRRPLRLSDNILSVGRNQICENDPNTIIECEAEERYKCDQIITSLGSHSDFQPQLNNVFSCGWARMGSHGTVHDTLVDTTSLTSRLAEVSALHEGRKLGLECPNLMEKLNKISVVSTGGWRKVKKFEEEHNTRVGDYHRLMELCHL